MSKKRENFEVVDSDKKREKSREAHSEGLKRDEEFILFWKQQMANVLTIMSETWKQQMAAKCQTESVFEVSKLGITNDNKPIEQRHTRLDSLLENRTKCDGPISRYYPNPGFKCSLQMRASKQLPRFK